MYLISPWLEESLAFVTGVVTIFFLVRSKELRQNNLLKKSLSLSRYLVVSKVPPGVSMDKY